MMARTLTSGSLDPTQPQIDYVRGMQKKLHLSNTLLNNHCVARFKHPFNDLDRHQISALIDEMKQWTAIPGDLLREAGQQELPFLTSHSETYTAYLASDAWAQRRKAVLQRTNGKCQRCGNPATEVHHKTYERLGQERDSDLEAVCSTCHKDADRQRASQTAARQWDARLDGWASKRYGDDWDTYGDSYIIEDEFHRWLESRNG